MRRIIPMQIFLVAALIAFYGATASAQSTEQDLINADRPGIADGSTVVGPKTFQIESGIQQEYRRHGNDREHTFFVPTLLRFGVSSRWEIRIEGNDFTRDSSFDSTSTTNHTSGFAPLSLGFKYHIHQSKDAHEFSLGTIVRVFPAWGSEDFRPHHVTGDARLAADWKFGPGMKLSLNPNVGVARYEDDQGRAFAAGLFAVTLGYNPTNKISPFVDLGLQFPEAKNGQTSAIFDGGIAFIIGENWQLDAAIGTRVHGDTGPRPFIGFGVSWRARWKRQTSNSAVRRTI